MKLLIRNRKATFNYEILEKYTAGIVLEGWEVKSILSSDCSISEGYIQIKGNDVLLKSCHIKVHAFYDGFDKKNEYRDRILLLKKTEKNKIKKLIEQKGLTVIPTAIVYSNTRKIKIEFAVCRGKKVHDKRQDLKNKQLERETNRKIKI